jgi:hypothetical protein
MSMYDAGDEGTAAVRHFRKKGVLVVERTDVRTPPLGNEMKTGRERERGREIYLHRWKCAMSQT